MSRARATTAAGLSTAAALALALPASALAAPDSVICPPSGEILPLRPVVYLFEPVGESAKGAAHAGDLIGRDARGDLPLDMTRLDGGPAFVATRIAARPKGETFMLASKSDPAGPPVGAYSLIGAPPQPAASTVDLLEAAQVAPRRMELKASVNAPAYRLEWSTSAEDFAAGRRQRRAVPAIGGVVSLGEADAKLPFTTFEWTDERIFAGLAALRSDGGEIPPGPTPLEIPRPTGYRVVAKRMANPLPFVIGGLVVGLAVAVFLTRKR